MSRIYKRAKSPYFQYEFYKDGRKKRLSTRVSKRNLAKQIQDDWDLRRAKGDYSFMGRSRNSLVTNTQISEYIEHYKDFLEGRKSANTNAIVKGVLSQFELYLETEGIYSIDQITVPHINGYIDFLTVTPKTKKNHLGVISLMFKQAILEGHIVQNPCENATLPRIIPNVRHRQMTPKDLKVIFKNSSKWRLYYAILLYTGLRAGDVAMLLYENIDVKGKKITQLIRKSRRVHELPLSDLLLKEIGSIKGKRGPVFPYLYNENERKLNDRLAIPRKSMQKMLEDAELPKATLHSFRVTYNNMLRDQGLSIQDRQVLLTHTSSETTKIYTHPNMKLAAKHLNKMPNYLDKPVK